MPRKERRTRLLARQARAARASTSLSPSGRSLGAGDRDVERRGAGGSTPGRSRSTSSSSEATPSACRASRRPRPRPSPRWRRTKVSVRGGAAAWRRSRRSLPRGRSARARSPVLRPCSPLLAYSSYCSASISVLEVAGRGEPDLDQPALAVRVLVEQLGIVDDGVVDLDDLAGHRACRPRPPP